MNSLPDWRALVREAGLDPDDAEGHEFADVPTKGIELVSVFLRGNRMLKLYHDEGTLKEAHLYEIKSHVMVYGMRI